jgi:pyruvate ferredoxin oxidoreductase alpha subunit
VGLLKLRYLRPFPKEKLVKVLNGKKSVGVIDKNMSFGYEGTIFTNVNSALTNLEKHPKTINFIGGLGGRDITKENLENAFDALLDIDENSSYKRIQYMNVRCEE